MPTNSSIKNSHQSQNEMLEVLLSDQSLVSIGILQDGVIKYVNPTVSELTGYSSEEIMKWQPGGFGKLVHPEDRAFVMEQARKKQMGEKDVVDHYSYRIITKAEEIKWIDLFSKTIMYEGRPADFITVIDITEQKQAEAALLESAEKYRTLFEESRDAIYFTTRDGRFIDANPAIIELFGFPRDELFRLNTQELYVHPEDRFRFQQEIEKNGSVRDYEVKLRKSDGTVMDCLLTSTVRQAKNGSILGYQGIIRDIIEHKRSEEALQESEVQFRLLSEQSLLGIILLQDDVIKYANQASAEISGFSQEQIMSWSPNEFAKLVHPEDRSFVMEQARKKQAGEKDVETHYSCRIIPKSGETRWLDIYSKVITYEGRNANFVTLIDITEQKRGEIALKESEQKFRVVSESALVGLAIVQENQLKYANEAAARMAGYAREEILKWTIKDFMKRIYADDQPIVLDQLQKKQTGIKTGIISQYPIRVVTKSGEMRWAVIFSKTIFYQGKPADLVTLIDITEQKRAEEAVRESETKYSTLVEHAKDGVVIVLDGECKFANRALAEILGYSINEIIGTPFLDLVSQESRDLVIQRYKERMAGITAPPFDEFKLQCKDGFIKDVEVSVGIIQYQGRPAIHGIVRDVTERIQIREAQRALEDKRANFIEITSHELRTPLTAIRGYTELLQQRVGELDQASRELCFEAINRNVQRLERLVKGVSTLRQLERGLFRLELQEMNFCDFLAEALQPYQTRLGLQLEFHSCLDGIQVIVEVDPDRLLQVLDNILENAVKQTSQDRRKIIVATKIQPQTVQVQVIDNGAGINPDDLERIFDPFVFIPTTTSASGTGIGLYLSRMIANAHKGTLIAHSEGKGQGSTFTLKLPRKEGE
ncbi:MAG: PAS domain S-box protein [Candidatus Heimdallarchaeota archaeon]